MNTVDLKQQASHISPGSFSASRNVSLPALRTIPPFSNIRLEIIALSNVHQLATVDVFVSGRKNGVREMTMFN